MNHVYRLIWNYTTRMWAPAAESARGRGKGGSSRSAAVVGALAVTVVAVAGALSSAGASAAGLQLCGADPAASGRSFGNVSDANVSCAAGLAYGLSSGFRGDGGGNSSKATDGYVRTWTSGLTQLYGATKVEVESRQGPISIDGQAGVNINMKMRAGRTTIGGNGVVDVSSQKIDGVLDGRVDATSKEAINGAQLHELDTRLTNSVTTATGAAAAAKAAAGKAQGTADSAKADANLAQTTATAAGTAAVKALRTADSAKSDAAAVDKRIDDLVLGGSGVMVDVARDGREAATVKDGSKGVALGAQADAQGQRGVAIGAGAQSSADGSVALGAQAVASAQGAVAIGAGSTADRANTVSVGAQGSERQITNVAPGTQATDAVNLGQAMDLSRQAVSQAVGQAVQQANAYTDQKVNEVRQAADAGIAGAMAMAGLTTASHPGRNMVSAAASTYEGQTALAIGVSTMSEDGRRVYKISGSSTSRGNVGATVAVGFHW